MGLVPGNMIFVKAARNYGDTSVRTESFTLSGLTTSDYYKPGNARTIDIQATGDVDVIVQAGHPGPFGTPPRKLNIAGTYAPASGVVVGMISDALIPNEFAIKDTSNSSNLVTLHFNY